MLTWFKTYDGPLRAGTTDGISMELLGYDDYSGNADYMYLWVRVCYRASVIRMGFKVRSKPNQVVISMSFIWCCGVSQTRAMMTLTRSEHSAFEPRHRYSDECHLTYYIPLTYFSVYYWLFQILLFLYSWARRGIAWCIYYKWHSVIFARMEGVHALVIRDVYQMDMRPEEVVHDSIDLLQ